MSKSIRRSPKHGLNPSVCHCQFCGKEHGVALLGRLKDDAEAPRHIINGVCEDCEKVLDNGGLMVIEVRDGETGKNPYRTGRVVGVSAAARQKLGVSDEHPACYMPESVFSDLFDDHSNNQANQTTKE